jgi:uncharacterized protein
VTRSLLAELGYGPDVVGDKGRAEELQQKLRGISPDELAGRLDVGAPTLCDMLDALARPGRDPREDLPPPVFRKGILKLEDLTAGMELKGTVLNVVDFGAFVDIGLKDSGLVHISQMANRYIKSPYDVVAVGDVVDVWVLKVEKDRHRVSLTMIKPGTERKPPERRPQGGPPQQQQDRGARPPRGGGRRPGGPPQGQPAGAGPQRGPARHGGPPRHGGPRPQGPPQPVGEQQRDAGGSRSAPPPRPAPPPRKPRRPTPPPKLSQAALEGKASLRTFAELSAFLAAKQTPAEPPAPPPQAESPPPEAPAAEAPAPAPPPDEPAAATPAEPVEVPASAETAPPPA